MPRILKTLVVFIFCLIATSGYNEVKATHAMGGDLTFECVSPGVYLWRLKLYRDCFGIPTNTVQPITISGCGNNYNLSLNLVSGPIEVSPLCPGQIQNSACNGGSLPGVQQVIYEGTISLPVSCTNYVASWRLCCRNNQITTLNNPGSQYMYIETVLDNTIVPCNNSPVFNNIPTPYVCVGQPVNYNHGVTDPDGDLLVFSLVDCYHNAGVPVDYLNPPYSATYPLSTVSGTVNLDTQTGAISFTPDIIQIGVMCVRVEEFRNGVKIGETVRDMQFVVLPCNNTPPDAGPFEENGQTTGSYDYFICTGTSFCLNIPGGDLDGDNVFMSWNNGIPTGTFTVSNNNTPNPVGTFCWAPTTADLGVNFFTVTEVDDACPISGVTVATYTIIVADNVTPITATISPNPATICPGDFEILTATASPQPGNYSYEWHNAANGGGSVVGIFPNYVPPGPGWYSVIIEDLDSGGCAKDTSNVQVILNPLPIIDQVNPAVCVGGSVQIVLSDTLTYNWAPPGGLSCTNCYNPTVTINNTTTYYVTATNTAGCSVVESITVPIYSVNVTVNANQTNPCQGGSGSLTATPNGAVNPVSYNWSNGGTTAVINNLAPGTYTVTITDANGCSAVQSGTINASPILTIISTVQQIQCTGGSDGSISVVPSGGTSPYTYTWSNGVTGTGTISGLSPGTYTTTVTDANGCTGTGQYIISDPAPLAVSVQVNQNVSCFGGNDGQAEIISVTGGNPPYTYQWDSGETGTIATNLQGGLGFVTVTDAFGCDVTQFLLVLEPPNLAPLATVENIDCYGSMDGSIIINTIGGTPPYNIVWASGQTSPIITGLGPGNYQYTITDSKGCTVNGNEIITQQSQLIVGVTLVSAISCNNDSDGSATATGAGGVAPYSFEWDNGETAPTATALDAGIHYVTVTDDNGCIGTGAITIPDAPPLVLNVALGGNVTCNGGSDGSATATASGGTSPYVYLWSNGSGSQTVNNLPAGTHTVTVTDANGCSATSGIQIIEPPVLFILALHQGNPSCAGLSDGSAISISNGGTPPYTYLWTNGETTSGATGLAAGTHVIVITDANGCTASDDVIITPTPDLVASAVVNQNITCNGDDDGSATATVGGGTPPYTFLWDNGDATLGASFLNPGVHTFTVTDANGCTETASVTILEPTALVATISNATNISCYSGTDGSFDINVSGGTAGYDVTWTGPTSGNTTLPTAGSTTVSNLGQGTYYISVTDANGCSETDEVTLTQPTEVSLAEISNGPAVCGICSGMSTVAATGGTTPYSYMWSNGDTTPSTTGLCQGAYSVTVTDAQGCTDVLNINIGVITVLDIFDEVLVEPLCNGDATGSVSISVSGGQQPYTYNWSNGATTEDISGLNAGSYYVSISALNGACFETALYIIDEPDPLVSVVLQDAIPSCVGASDGSATAGVSGGTTPYTYQWDNGESTPTATNLGSGSHSITITDDNGCSMVNSVNIGSPPPILLTTTLVNNVSCNGGSNGQISVTMGGGTPPYTYNWTGPTTGSGTQTNPGSVQLTNLPAGNYSVTLTDDNGCQIVSSTTITEPTLLVLNVQHLGDVDCNGNGNGSAIANVSGGTTPYIYQWSNGESTPTASFLGGGTHSVTVTDLQGCMLVGTVSIFEPPLLTANLGTVTPVSCSGGSDGSATITVTGGTTPYAFNWSNGATTQNLTGLTAGTYFCTITDLNGCFDNVSVNITQPTLIVLSATSTAAISCNGLSDGVISGTIIGGTSPYTYNWSGPMSGSATLGAAGPFTLTGLSAGFYTITVIDDNGCEKLAGVNVTEPPVLLAQITNAVDILCPGYSDGTATISVSGGTTPYVYQWSNGGNSGTINNVPAGTYTITITDNNGCVVTNSVTLLQPTITVTVSLVDNVSCNGGNNGSAVIGVTGGSAPYTYIWSTGETTPSGNLLVAGVNTFTVTDFPGCVVTGSINITEPPLLSAVLTVDANVSCYQGNDGAASVAVTGGTLPYDYQWSNGSTIATAQTLVAGPISVTVTDANGCIIIDSDNITEPPLLSSSASITSNVSCFGGSDGQAIVTATGGTTPYIYAWSNGQSTPTASGLYAGTHSVTIVDANGCVTMSAVTFGQPTPMATSFTSVPITCFGANNGSGTVSASGGTPPYSYSWPSGANTATANNLAPGIHLVTITDANGCFEIQQVVVQEPGPISAAAIPVESVTCPFGNDGIASVNVGGGVPNYTFEWNTGNTNQTAIGLTAGTYTVTVTDSNGCTQTSSVVIDEPDPINGTFSGIGSISCFGGNDGTATISGTGGTPPFSYDWSNGETGNVATMLTVGTHYVTITDSEGCWVVESVNILEPSLLTATTNPLANITCNGLSNGSANVVPAGGTTPYTYLWDNNETTSTAIALNAGTHLVTVTDGNGCTTTASVTLTEPPVVSSVTSVNSNVLCNGDANGSATVTATGGTPPYVYIWSNGEFGQTAVTLTAGSHTVTVTDANGCTFVDNVAITEPAILSLSVVNDNTIPCFGLQTGIATGTATGGTTPYTYQWSSGSTGATASGLGAGVTYSLTVTDGNGCIAVATTSFTSPVVVSGTIIPENPICFGENSGLITLTASGGVGPYLYSFDNGATFNANPILPGVPSGTYDVVIEDSNGCQWTNSATLVDPPQLVLTANPDYFEILLGESVNIQTSINSTDSIDYTWTPTDYLDCIDCPDPVSTPFETTIYDILAVDENGCEAEEQVTIVVDTDDRVFIPNIFTPNGDNINDAVTVFSSPGVEEVEYFKIYDRWGELMFEAANFQPNDLTLGWNGMFRGKMMNPAVFVYHAKVKFVNGTSNTYKGDITIAR